MPIANQIQRYTQYDYRRIPFLPLQLPIILLFISCLWWRHFLTLLTFCARPVLAQFYLPTGDPIAVYPLLFLGIWE